MVKDRSHNNPLLNANRTRKLGWLCCALVICILAALFTTRQASAKGLRFAINEFVVTGNALLANDEIQSLVAPFTGKDRQLSDIQAAAKNVEAAYRSQGYGAVKVIIPGQKLTEGTVQLNVVEPPVSTILVSGNEHFSEQNIRRSLPSFKTGETPNTKALLKDIERANEHPDKKVGVVFRQGDTPGTIEALVEVDEKSPGKWTLKADNYGTDPDTEYRTGVGYSHSNVLGRDHQAKINVTVLPEKLDQFASVSGSYAIPFRESGDRLTVYGGASFSESGRVAGVLDVAGKGYAAGVNYRHRLPDTTIGESKLKHGITTGIAVKHVDPDVTFLGRGESLVPALTIAPITVGYDATLSDDTGRRTSGSVAITSNFVGDEDDLAATRAGAGASFNILKAQLKHIEPLADGWALAASLRAQYSDSPLVPLEQTGLGGAGSLRALSPRTFADDNGYAASIELYSPDFGGAMAEGLSMRGSVFMERAGLTRNNPQVLERDSVHMSDIGVGLVVDYQKWLRLRFDLAWLLADGGFEELDDVRANISIEADIRQ